ncbi:MAG: DUF3160 domain-containing protein [Polyangiaceae bacterium]
MAPGFRFASIAAAALVAACGSVPGPVATHPPRERAARRSVVAPPPPNAAAFWQGVALSYDPELPSASLPIDEADLIRDEGAAPLFTALAPADRAVLLRDGFVVVPTARARNHMGAFYTDLEEGHVPVVITVDALAELAHLSLWVAISEANILAEKPAIHDWLTRVEAHLTAERNGASSNLIAPYRIALGFVAVARSLEDAAYVPPADLSDVVGREKIAIAARAGISKSALFGLPVDYRSFPKDSHARMRAWLAFAPFAVGHKEAAAPRHQDVASERNGTTAALLLARATDKRVDAVTAADLARVLAIERFLAGPSDGADLHALAELAPKAKIDLTDGTTIANVVRIDKLRALVREAAAPKLLDGEVCGPSVHFLGASVPVDGVAMQALITPAVPLRSMPSALDVAAWLGSDEALAQISARGDNKLAGYSRALSALYLSRPRERHASIYLSSLDVVASMLAPSVSRAALAASKSAAFRKTELDSALSAWTSFRSDFSGIRAHLGAAPPSPALTPNAKPTLVYVEPEIEVIGNLTALVRQTLHGLDALGALNVTSPARSVLQDADQLLTVAFEVALLAANDESPTAQQRATLATLPAWLDSLENALDSETVRSVVVHRNQGDGSRLRESTQTIENIFLALREPHTHRLILAVGAHVPHVEEIETSVVPKNQP